MSVAKLKRDLMPPEAPLPPDVGQAGKPTQGDDIRAPLAGELVAWTFTAEFYATATDPWGRDTAELIRAFLKTRGFSITEPRLAMPARKVPRAIATTSTR